MIDQSAHPETGPLADLPPLSRGWKCFEGSAGLAIFWHLEAEAKPATLHCDLYALAPNSDYASGTPTGRVRLTLAAPMQSFQVERRLGADSSEIDGIDVDPRQASGVIYLGRRNDRPGQLRPDDPMPIDEPLYLHVHCRLGASSGFLGKIARGRFGQLLTQATEEPTPDDLPAPVAHEAVPAKSAPPKPTPAKSAPSKSSPAKGKPRGSKPPR